MRIGILGMARSGIAAALKVLDMGGNVFISERRTVESVRDSFIKKYDPALWDKLSPLCEFGCHTDRVLDSDYIIVSPGIPLSIPILQKAVSLNIKLMSEIEFGYRIKSPDSKIIAVTGSNGKSTTVSIIDHILTKAGKRSILAGNIGNPLTSFPIEEKGIDYIVLELSSFQLELIEEFTADRAALLNITPDHLDRYKTFAEYANAKMNIFRNQDKDNYAILNRDDPYVMKQAQDIKAEKLYFGTKSGQGGSDHTECRTDIYFDGEQIIFNNFSGDSDNPLLIDKKQVPLAGLHNIYNIMSALLAIKGIVNNREIIIEALESFRSLPHRLEKVAIKKGITFVNDSKATNTEAVKYALSAFPAPVHIIMGGYHKGEDYSVLNPLLKENSKAIYLIGDASEAMYESFKTITGSGSRLKIYRCVTLEDAVETAFNNAVKDEVVLLAPACASYDMFENYEHRGNAFKQAVKLLTINDDKV